MRRLVEGCRVLSIRQIGFDRQLEIVFARSDAKFRLIAELTGKHSNLILVGDEGTVIAAAHYVSSRQSSRSVLPGKVYQKPPFPPRDPVYKAARLEEAADLEGASPFLLRLAKAQADHIEFLAALEDRLRKCQFEPVAVEGLGVYPVPLEGLGLSGVRAESLSSSLEGHFDDLEKTAELESARSRLLAPLRRVLLAREVALEDLNQARQTARNASRLQLQGELLLAYASQIPEGAKEFETQDYEGNPLTISLDPDLSPLENAQKLFDKAKKSKLRADHVADQFRRIEEDRVQLLGAVRRAEDAQTPVELFDIGAKARERRWLHDAPVVAQSAEEKPFEGHRIRERLGPGGVRVLYGENATSNDYLTLRVARPNDIWMHVRGSTSAHVVILTGNQPDRIGREALEYAGRIAVQNSASKHSSYVPVDYTLKKYVRKPKGAKAGTAFYTHEKTLHISAREGA